MISKEIKSNRLKQNMKLDNRIDLNGMKVFPFCSATELLAYVDCHKGILVAVNAEKVMKVIYEI